MTNKVDIYHGSRMIIKKPIFGEGNPRNDYGLGFYCTHEIELAKECACTDENSGYANHYELDISGLSVMRLDVVILGVVARDLIKSFHQA